MVSQRLYTEINRGSDSWLPSYQATQIGNSQFVPAKQLDGRDFFTVQSCFTRCFDVGSLYLCNTPGTLILPCTINTVDSAEKRSSYMCPKCKSTWFISAAVCAFTHEFRTWSRLIGTNRNNIRYLWRQHQMDGRSLMPTAPDQWHHCHDLA